MILVLNSSGGWKPAMLLNSEGAQKELACFERDKYTQAFHSCSIIWNNQLFIFGGNYNRRLISRLTGYKLEKANSSLSFDHEQGACSVMANSFVYLCFPNGFNENDSKRCRRSTGPLEQFTEVSLSANDHLFIQTSSSDSKS